MEAMLARRAAAADHKSARTVLKNRNCKTMLHGCNV